MPGELAQKGTWRGPVNATRHRRVSEYDVVGVTVDVWTVDRGQVITEDGYDRTSIGSNAILVLVSGCFHGAVVEITGRSQVKVTDDPRPLIPDQNLRFARW
jgi:hypothetical protein